MGTQDLDRATAPIFFDQTVTKREQSIRKEDAVIDSDLREVRSSKNHLLCKANDETGDVETEGPHKMAYRFNIPVGGSFTVTRGSIISKVTRTATGFIVADRPAA